jgi:hypothetical protein
MKGLIVTEDQRWFYQGLYLLDNIREEQDETKEYVQYNYRKESDERYSN